MNRPILSTARLELVPMSTEHLPVLVELDANAEVLRYVLGRSRSTEEVHDYWSPDHS